MCGITGIINLNKNQTDKNLIKEMNDLIKYRGPDDEGFYYDDENGLAFGHRRLSILDLSSLGHQPMSSKNGDLWIVYNGEVYNYIELKDELLQKGYVFESKTDTEVILKAYQEWGEDCVKKFNGMWAFAIWDKVNKKLFCSRDRFGVKPFYYFYNNNVFVFGSEIKQILLHPEYKFSVNKAALYDYIAFGHFNISEETFYENINQLFGAHSLVLDLSSSESKLKIHQYWDINLNKKSVNFSDKKKYTRKFYELFYDSVKLRLRSDVPVASCLSGGLDSSSIVCMVNKQLKETTKHPPQETYSSCYEDKRFDESKYVKIVEDNLDIKPHRVYPTPEDFKNTLENIVWHMDSPTVNGSIYSQRCVFKAAHENGIKVMLDGQGGDEVLAGYHSYFPYYLVQLIKEFNFIQFLKELYYLRKIHKQRLNEIITNISALAKKHTHKSSIDWLDNDFQNSCQNLSTSLKLKHRDYCSDKLKNILYKLIRYTNMPALLHYEDRNSMTFSVESRVPFLDYKLVEYAFTLPGSLKIKNGTTKIILRSALKNLLPEEILKRQDKMGFESPDSVWIHTVFRNYLLNLLDSKAAKELTIFNIDLLKKHISQRLISHDKLWKIIGIIVWYDIVKNKVNRTD